MKSGGKNPGLGRGGGGQWPMQPYMDHASDRSSLAQKCRLLFNTGVSAGRGGK